jgi:hypothetical protein
MLGFKPLAARVAAIPKPKDFSHLRRTVETRTGTGSFLGIDFLLKFEVLVGPKYSLLLKIKKPFKKLEGLLTCIDN